MEDETKSLITMTVSYYKKALQEAYKKGFADALIQSKTHKTADLNGIEYKANIVDGNG